MSPVWVQGCRIEQPEHSVQGRSENWREVLKKYLGAVTTQRFKPLFLKPETVYQVEESGERRVLADRKGIGKVILNTVFVGMIVGSVMFLSDDPFLRILAAAFATVLFIVFGKRGRAETQWENYGLPGREFFLPLALLAFFMFDGAIKMDALVSVIEEKMPIIALILSFAVISNGFARSGFFEWAAYKIVVKCGGDTRRLITIL